MLFKRKFDLVVSIGEDCACSSYLRRCKLQDFSYPFDWLSNADFDTRIQLLCNDFAHFLDFEDLEYMDIINRTECDSYNNKRNHFHYYHDFLKNLTIEQSYPAVKEKYDRRIKRLFQQIETSKNVLFVWYSKDKLLDIEQIKQAHMDLKEKFNTNDVCMLCIENFPKEEFIELFEGNLIIAHYDNASYQHNPKWNETMGNETNNLKIFSQIKMKRELKWYIKYLFYSFLKKIIGIIPIKSTRHNMKNKLNIMFYKEAL